MASIYERDRQSFFSVKTRSLSLGEIYERDKRIVILGDPGSGTKLLLSFL